ncbi:MAG: hypothetical protein V4683_07420 [Bacteroidota bacterium]
MDNEKSFEVLNILVRTNNDGIEGYENAGEESQEQDLKNFFSKLAHTSIYCMTLIRLLIKTAKELYPTKFANNFILNQFKKKLLLNHLIGNNISFQNYRDQKFITHQESGK